MLYAPPNKVVALTASDTITEAEHEGVTLVVNAAAGATFTLPAATGSGKRYNFVIGTTVTSNTVVIQVADATDVFIGNAWVVSDSAAAVLGYAAGATDDTITLNGTTKGGYAGHRINFVDTATNQWEVQSFGKATGAEATPFSAAVS